MNDRCTGCMLWINYDEKMTKTAKGTRVGDGTVVSILSDSFNFYHQNSRWCYKELHSIASQTPSTPARNTFSITHGYTERDLGWDWLGLACETSKEVFRTAHYNIVLINEYRWIYSIHTCETAINTFWKCSIKTGFLYRVSECKSQNCYVQSHVTSDWCH